MITINFPSPKFNIKPVKQQPHIFDGIRKKWLLLTEEEWVRQNFIAYLCEAMRYPKTLVALEKELQLGDLKKRFDILIYDTLHQPWMLVECKAPQVALTNEVLQQVLRYGITIPAPYLVITNGNETYAWQKKEGQLAPLQQLPEFLMHH